MNDLKIARDHIDQIDATLVELIARRIRIAEHIADIKRREKLPLSHPSREEEVIRNVRDFAQKLSISPDLIEEVMKVIIKGSKESQAGRLS